MKICQNCEHLIRNLEESYLYQGDVVCKKCKILLEEESQDLETFDKPSIKQQNKRLEKNSCMMSKKDVMPSDNMDVSTVPKGIGGWLIIPAIGIVFGSIKAIILFFSGIGMIQSFNPELMNNPLLWATGSIDVIMIIAAIIVMILFFKKCRIAVVAIISLMAATIVANFIQLLLDVGLF